MKRFLMLMMTALLTTSAAHAQASNENAGAQPETATVPPTKDASQIAWEGVYERSGKTIKAGEYMGIFGGSFMVIGVTTALIGGVNAITGGTGALLGDEDGADRASNGMSQVTVGAAVGITGFVGFQTGPALTAGGSVRQAKAIRQINPSAPRPWLGYSAWVPWGIGLPPTPASFLLQPAAYVLAGLQKGKNRLHWDARTAAYYEENRPRVMVNVAPITVNGNKGLALVGTF